MEQEVRYCTTEDGVTIAYAVSGRGKRWLVHTSNDLSATLQYETEGQREWVDVLGEHFIVVRYDSRGTGLSQRECEDLSMPALSRDLAAVIDAIDPEPFVLYGHLGGVFAAALYIAGHADRVDRLVLWPPPLIDFGDPRNRTLGRLAVTDWATFTETYAHIALGWARGEASHQFAVAMRATVTQDTWIRFMRQFTEAAADPTGELLAALSEIRVPTLVIQRSSYADFPRIASLIGGSRTKMVEGDAVGPSSDPAQVRAIVNAIAEFTGAVASRPATSDAPVVPVDGPAHGTAVILFTDIADSTALTERMGDAVFRDAARKLDANIRAAMTANGGTPVEGKVLGDGVMGVFQSAARAIAAARECERLSEDLPMHIGLHAGDVISEGANVYGGAVNIASRICGVCQPGEILVSSTVRELARTSAGVTFEERGDHMLKGIEDAVRIFAVTP